VSALCKSTGKVEKITIANNRDRLSKEQIDKMVKEAEKYKDQDEKLRKKIDAKNTLESYMNNVNNALK